MRVIANPARVVVLGLGILVLLMVHPLADAASTADPARVLVVYNATWTGDEDGDGVQDSLAVAQYYMTKRGVPAANILGVATNDSGYDATTYATMHSELITPLKNKLAALGSTTIDIILMSYRMPVGFGSQSIDNLIMGLNYWNTTSVDVNWMTNPYLEPTPGIGSDNGGFLHSLYTFNNTTMYLVCRLDGSFGVGGCLDLVDQALYGDRYVSSQAGYYGGNIYVDSDGRGGTSDAALAANPAVQSGNYGSYSNCDANIAYGERYVAASGFPLKWNFDGPTIGAAGLTFQDGSDATSAPRALMYGGWYNYNNYKNVFEWLPGSVACDLNSSSLVSYWLHISTTPAWGRRALCAGATCVCGVSSEPGVTGHTRPNILLYYMLNGYSFAEAAAAANPAIGWMSYAIGDPLYAPTRAKTLVKDTQNPVFAAGSPALVMNVRNGCAVKILVADTPEPEVAKARIDYGSTTAYGQSVTSSGYFRRHLLSLTELPASTLIHYRVTLTDPVGNVTTTSDQTFTTPAQTPHGGTPWPIPGTIACADFDDGGEGVAYHDTLPDNYVTNQYRSDTGVEVTYWTPYVLAYWGTQAGEWLEYTVNATQSGTYSIDVAFDNGDGGKFHIACDGVDQTGQLTATSSSAAFTVTATGVSLSAGVHVIRLSMDVPGANGFIGEFATMTFTRTGGPTGDTTPPVVSAVLASAITVSGTTITWTTDEASDSQVQYGTTTSYGSSSTLGTTMVTAHSVALSGLTAGTLYHYRVVSRDAAGNLATSGDVTFTTTSTPDTTPPVISGVTPGSITATSVVITWTTNEVSSSQTQYGLTTSYGSTTVLDASMVTSHSVVITGLAPSTVYHVRVLSRDAAGNLTTSGDVTVTSAALGTSSISSGAGDEDGRHQPNKSCGIGTGGIALMAIACWFVRRRRG